MITNFTYSDDLVEDILSRLSVRQLLRFRCVSKSWRAIVDNPRFINKHHERHLAILKEEGDIPLLLSRFTFDNDSSDDDDSSDKDVPTQELHTLSKRYGDVILCVTPDLKRDSAPQSPKILKHFRYVSCIGCANGVVLLEWNFGCNSNLGLWNPATREFKVVPPRKPRLNKKYHHGMSTLGFDPKSNDFKIIRPIFGVEGKDHYEMNDMYSLNTDSWRSITIPCYAKHNLSFVPEIDCGVYINNIHYWPCTSRYNKHVPEREKPDFIFLFDFCSEMFQVLSQPLIQGEDSYSLGNYNGSLACICKPYFSLEQLRQQSQTEIIQRLEIWVMTKIDDHGIPSSWQHLFTIGPFPEHFVTFCSFRVGGDILITLHAKGYSYFADMDEIEDGCLYDPATKNITKRFGFGFSACFEYVESLFKLSKRI